MKIVNSGFNIHRKYAGDCAILLNWVRYHKVLYKFSIQHWQQRTPQMELMAKSDILVSDSAYDIDLITVWILILWIARRFNISTLTFQIFRCITCSAAPLKCLTS